jgi:hypothetical protein
MVSDFAHTNAPGYPRVAGAGTETERVKRETVRRMSDDDLYSQAAAELTTRRVMDRVSHRWD